MTKVQLAYPYTDLDGKAHKPDDTIDVGEAEANALLFDGKARPAEAKAAKTTTTKEA